jgi:hypothetical protein
MTLNEAMVEEAALGWFEELSCKWPRDWPQTLLKGVPLRNLPAQTGVARD